MSYTIHLNKQDFKFSSTHFTIFSQDRAEALHGHNYYVHFAIQFQHLDKETGLTAEFSELKKLIRAACDSLDEKVLLPAQSPFVEINLTESNIEVQYNKKFYSFPIEDCEILDIVNTSAECLAKWLYTRLAGRLKDLGCSFIEVTLQETQGQSVTYTHEGPL